MEWVFFTLSIQNSFSRNTTYCRIYSANCNWLHGNWLMDNKELMIRWFVCCRGTFRKSVIWSAWRKKIGAHFFVTWRLMNIVTSSMCVHHFPMSQWKSTPQVFSSKNFLFNLCIKEKNSVCTICEFSHFFFQMLINNITNWIFICTFF